MAGFPTAAAHVQARCGRLGYRAPAVARVARAVPARSVLFEQTDGSLAYHGLALEAVSR